MKIKNWIIMILVFSLLLFFKIGHGEERISGGNTIEPVACANLIYAGTRSSVCFSDRFLTIIAGKTSIRTSRKFKPVKLADQEIYQFPFAVMTGEGNFSLSINERRNLRNYLEQGGFLLASAGCSSKKWDDAFKREMKIVFPERSLKTLSFDHEIFQTVFEIKKLGTKKDDTTLNGLTIGGKIVLVYSSDGLNDTQTMHGCCCCGGNEIANAQEMNVNILTYALLQ
jgi:hypothetical protein